MIRLLLRPTLNLLARLFMSGLLLFVAAGLVFAFGASVAPDLVGVQDWAPRSGEAAVLTALHAAPTAEKGQSVLADPPPSTPAAEGSKQLPPEDYQESWRQAGSGEETLGQRLRTHRVELASGGQFLGRISLLDPETSNLIPVRDLRVYFVQRGRIVQTVQPGEDGVFRAQALDPGVYSLIAAGPDGFVAYSLQVEAAAGAAAKAALLDLSLQTPFRFASAVMAEGDFGVDSLAVPPSNFTALRDVVRDYVSSQGPAAELLEPAREEIPRGAARAEEGAEQQQGQASPAPGTTLRRHRVNVQADGKLLGRVRRLHRASGRPLSVRRLNVFLLQDNTVVNRTTVSDLGVFEFTGVSPGVYSLAAASREGFAAFSIDVGVAGERQASLERPMVRPVAAPAEMPEELQLDIGLVDPEDYPALLFIYNREFGPLGAGFPGAGPPGGAAAGAGPGAGAFGGLGPSGFGPGGGFGGGAGAAEGGFGGLGALLGLGAAAAAAGGWGEDQGQPFYPIRLGSPFGL